MKKLVLTLTAALAAVGAFAQGKVSFQNDSTRLVYYDSSVSGLSGQAAYLGNTPTNNGSAITLMADMYMGTSSSSLSLLSTTTFSAVPGKWTSTSIVAPYAAGTTVYIVAQVRDAAFAAPSTWTSASSAFGTYYGTSQEFSYVLSGALSPPPMWNAGGTWAAGTFPLDQYGAGSKGAIAVSAVPEPTSLALAGLGIAAGLILRRRK